MFILKLGNLRHTKSLVYGNEEVLFVCKDEFGQDYLVEAYDSFESEYVIGRISESVLSDLIMNKIPMEEAFRKCEVIYTTQRESRGVVARAHDSKSFPGDMLPKKGVFLGKEKDYGEDRRNQGD